MGAQGQAGQNPTCQTDLEHATIAVRCCADATIVAGDVPCWYPFYTPPAPAPCEAPCFANGGLDVDEISGYVYMTPTGWTNGGGGTIVVQSGNGPWGGLNAASGPYFASIQGVGSYLEQT